MLMLCDAMSCRGFTSFTRDDYLTWKKEGRMINDGVNAKVRKRYRAVLAARAKCPAQHCSQLCLFFSRQKPLLNAA